MAVPAILQQMGRQSEPPQMQSLRQMVQTIRNAKNPTALAEQMMRQNPNMRRAMDYVRQHGGDPKSACYELARERGIDPQSILGGIL